MGRQEKAGNQGPTTECCPTSRVALPCPSRRHACCSVALPCRSRRPAGGRIALLPARRISACASPCPARAEPPCCPHRPAARRPAAARPTACSPAGRRPTTHAPPCWHPQHCPHRPARDALLCAALLAGALLPTQPCCAPPCCSRHPPAARPAVRRPVARATLLLPALLDGALLPVRRPTGSRTAACTTLPAPPCCCPPCSEFLDTNPPSMYITLYFIVTCLLDSLRAVRDHFLALDPTDLTDDLLEKHLLATETSVVAVGAARGTPRTPFFEGCSPSPLAPSYASDAAVDILGAEDVGAASAISGKRHSSKGKGGKTGGGGSGGGGGGGSGGGGGGGGGGIGGSGGRIGGGGGGSGGGGGGGSGSGGGSIGGSQGGAAQRGGVVFAARMSFAQVTALVRHAGSFTLSTAASPALMTLGAHSLATRLSNPCWLELLRSGVDIFALDYDAILATMYALSVSAEGDCYLCVPPDPGIEAAALGASESDLRGTALAEALHTFALDSGASHCFFRISTTLTPLCAPVPVRLADPSGGPVLARSSTVLPCVAVPSSSLSGLHLPSFSTKLVSTAALQDAMVTTTIHGGQRVSICTCTSTGHHLAMFTHRPGSSLYTLTTKPPQVAASAQVSTSGPVAAPYSCPLLSHQTLLWHHRLGHPSLPRLHGMHSLLLVSGLPRSLPPLPPSPAPPYLPCVEGRQRAAPHSSSFPQTTAPLQTLHMDVWGLARFSGQDRERYFPLQNEVAERRVGLLMEVAHTSMIHVAAPHFLWPFAVQYAAHQLNLWPRVSLPKTSPTLRWTGKVGDASVLRLWGSRAFVRDTSANKLSSRAIPCAFLGFPLDAPGWQFYHPTSRHVLPSQDVTFDESVPFCRPPQVDPLPPQSHAALAMFQVDRLPGTVPVEVAVDSGDARGAASGGAASRGAEPASAELGGAESEGAESGGTEPGGVEPGGAEPGGAEPGETEPEGGAGPGAGGTGTGGAGAGGAGAGDLGAGGAGAGASGAGASGAGGTGAGGAGAGGTGAGGTGEGGAGGTGAGGAGAGGTGARHPAAGGAGIRSAEACGPGAGGTVERGPFFVPLHPLSLSPPDSPESPLLAPSPYAKQTDSLTERREPESRPASPVRAARTGRRVPRPRLPPVPGTHIMDLRPSSVPLRSDLARAASPTVPRLLATVVTDPSFESTTASTLVPKLVDFVAACRLDYATSLVAESESDSSPSVGGECALGTDVLEDKQEEFECLAAVVHHLVAMLLAPERDPDAPDIPTPRSYAEAITGPYSSQWQTPMDVEMASWKSTGTYVNAIPPSGADIVDGMWIFRVKRPPGSPPVFKARYAARGFSDRQGVDFFQTFPPTPKMTTFRVPHKWHDTLRMTHAALGFAPSTADPSLFLRTDTSLPPFYVLVYLGLQITRDRARHTITLTQSHMVHQFLQRFGFRYSSPQSIPLPTGHSLSAPPSDESVEPSGLYTELVGCLMYLMTCTCPDLAYPLSILAHYIAPGRHRPEHCEAAKRVLRYLCS
ncbi:unnamed protein product [Closterium sp. NIES-54]